MFNGTSFLFCQCLVQTHIHDTDMCTHTPQYLGFVYLTDLLRMSSRQTATKHGEVLRETEKATWKEYYTGETQLLCTVTM